jgi:D-aspartate ligase
MIDFPRLRHLARGASPSADGAGLSPTTPAVVLGGDTAALGVVRSLGSSGIPVTVVYKVARCPPMYSRYAHAFVVSAMSGPALVDGLLALRTRLEVRPVLLLTNEESVHTISKHRERLEEGFRIRLPEHHTVCELLHKSSFQRFAEQHGFPVPRAIMVHEAKDLGDLAGIRFPAVIKPGAKEYIGEKTPRACRVSSREQAEAICREILPTTPDLIVQEWIEGAEDDVYFCLQYRGEGGITVSSFTGRKLRCWPPQTGSTASCMAAPELEPVLEPLTTAFFDKARFVGMCSMEFKRDRRTGGFVMVEPTVCRTDWQEEVASLHGVNIPLAAYRYELGLPALSVERASHPLIWRDPPGYWRSVIARRSFRDQAPPGARVKSACWRLEDPVPMACYCFEWLREVWSLARWAKLVSLLSRMKPATSLNLRQVFRK